MKLKVYMLATLTLFLAGCGANNQNAINTESGNGSVSNINVTQESESTGENTSEAAQHFEVNKFNFSGKTLEDEALTDEYFKNSKLTLVNIWASDCPPCIEEIPALQELSTEYEPSEFQIMGLVVNTLEGMEDNREDANSLVDQTGVTYKNVVPNESMLPILKHIQFVPTTFFVDSDGNLVGNVIVGSLTKDDFKVKVEELLK